MQLCLTHVEKVKAINAELRRLTYELKLARLIA